MSASAFVCLLAAKPAQAACTVLPDGVVPFFRLSPAGSGTVFTESTSTATATVEGAIAYDTTNDVLKVCDGTDWVSLSTGSGASASGAAGYVQISGGSGAFSSSSTTAEQQLFWDTTNHRLGIGTTAPGESIEIADNPAGIWARGNGSRIILGRSGWSSSQGLWLGVWTSNQHEIKTLSTNPLLLGTNNAEKMRIDVSGNVGIGTTAPNQGKVEVKGGTVCVDTDSDDNATSCITTESDARLKTNVQALDVSLDTFMKLRPVSFDWKHDDDEVLKHYPLIGRFANAPHSIGMIAQEVQALVPEAILPETVGDGEVQYLQLDYTKLVPVLIKALQDVKREKDAKIEALNKRLELQGNAIEALTKQLEVLERIILPPEARTRPQP